MTELILEMPTMFADHHVLKVRDALDELKGIDEIYASSAWKKIMISYKEKSIKPAEIKAALKKAGYPPGEGEMPVLVKTSAIKRDPNWEKLDSRVTESNQIDLAMSGHSRR
jgi:copper chaperone CopZ